MRITNASMVRSHLYDTQNNLTNMSKINQQISTEKVINTVSDDPHKAIKIMNINKEIKYTEKYNYNIDETVAGEVALRSNDGEVVQRSRVS